MKLVYITILSLFSSLALSQVCNDNIERSSIEGRFVNTEDGYILDVETMLRWNYCSLGQEYANGNCVGTPSQFETFHDALNAVASIEGHRIPNIKELATLVERSCVEPAIDQEVFPDTPLYVYWTSTPKASGSAMIIDFTDGSEIIRDINRPKVIRLVKE